ncbi:RNase P subunit p30 family protein [Halocatena pleomorpha]|uniref:Ribonuclease P protein component 3 n=1 Tax=Halocatena pleomorpha TaxID=1785090 RepID=A0A3P3RJN7_9EURY|nr:RNase P subunit p30 family protein [Halocatena pleomorpha]RRJ33622.1 ribonuclease P [Halocatena pleomorpha]
MYEAVHARPDGTSTVSRLALTASELEYDGLVVRCHDDAMAEYDPNEIAAGFGVDLVAGVELRADDRSSMASAITRHRSRQTIVCVHGGQHNRLACEDERVDVLAHPMADGDFNHVLARAAADNGVHIEFNFARVLRADGGERVNALRDLRRLRTLVDKYDVPYVVSGDPHSHLELRAPRELVGVGTVIGFTDDQIRHGLLAWKEIAARNRDRRSESFIEPGVRIGRYEEDD